MLFRIGRRLLHRRRITIVLGAALIGAATLTTGIGQSFDLTLVHIRALLRDRPPSGEIVLVEIDRRSLRSYGKWPWPRRYHGAIVDRLIGAGAEQVAFDIDFSSHSNPVDDRAFAGALARSGNRVILGSVHQPDVSHVGRMIHNVPIAQFLRYTRTGTIELPVGRDGVVRRGKVGQTIDGTILPTFSAQVAGYTGGDDARYPLDNAVDLGRVQRLSASDIVAGSFDAGLVRGKRVVIGTTAPEMGDRVTIARWLSAPGDRAAATSSYVVPGVFAQILAAETLLAGRVPVLVGGLPALLLALLAVAGLAWIRSRVAVAVLTAGTLLLLLVGPLVAEATLRWMFYVVPGLAVLFAGLLMRAIASLARSFFDSVATNELSGLPNAHALHFDARQIDRSHVAVARLQDLSAITAVLGEAQTGELLRRVSERIAFGTEGARVYHIGDAVFAWLVRPGTEDELPDRFEALHAMLAAPIKIGTRPIDVGVTYGLCTTERDLNVALRAATLAAERALERGLRWHSFSADEQDEASWRMSLLGELDGAIDAGQVWVAYQPKYAIASGAIVGAEALVRWLHPERGAIRPDHFVPLAEESGRIAKLTRHVLDTVLGDIATISDAHCSPVVAVNLSTTLLSAPNLVEMVCDALWRNGVLPEQLTLEVTESAAMTSDDNALAVLERFRSMGIGISIDDYGTGQSTLNYLKRLPATELKIDQSFIRAISDSRSDEILVNSTIQLGHQLGMKVVAEGVETIDVLRRLEAFGCDIVQGYLTGKPVPFNEFARIFRTPPRLDRAA